ncbi:MAG: TlyA family RNA methyltransferase [Deltaproteobacteria bacterium]|nr:TlyA family RNA methyltransferase [Deltaproteobacteria bacterium]
MSRPPTKCRLDRLLVDRGLASSLEKARALIYAGAVTVDQRPAVKPGKAVDPSGSLVVKQPEHPYVSRGGVKLAHALDHFGISVRGKTALDIGASTGGFTHCLLLRGVERVQAVDVGYGQLAWSLRQDPRVRVLERVNARYLTGEQIGGPLDMAVIDASFISLKLIIPPLLPILKPRGEILALVKPQFEVGRGKVGKGGVVRQEKDRLEAVQSLALYFEGLDLEVSEPTASPILGAKGNQEFFLYMRKKVGSSQAWSESEGNPSIGKAEGRPPVPKEEFQKE